MGKAPLLGTFLVFNRKPKSVSCTFGSTKRHDSERFPKFSLSLNTILGVTCNNVNNCHLAFWSESHLGDLASEVYDSFL
jgi:hypothetical protein